MEMNGKTMEIETVMQRSEQQAHQHRNQFY